MVVSLGQVQNAKEPMLVTETGILKSSKFSHPKKACSPIDVRDLGSVTFDNAKQFLYLQPIITQYFIDNKSEIWLLFLIAHSKR